MSCIFNDTILGGIKLIEPKVHYDSRGYFLEAMNVETLASLGIGETIVQENQAYSLKGVLRGLHLQRPPFAQGKLIRAIQGEILDVAVDVRIGSPTFGQHYKTVLSVIFAYMADDPALLDYCPGDVFMGLQTPTRSALGFDKGEILN